MKKYLFASIALSMLIANLSFSQEVISASGDHNQNSSGSISWTLGETVTETLQGTSSTLTQGFHQPVVKVISLEKIQSYSVDAYPNPTSDILNLKIEEDLTKGFHYVIYDINSRELASGKAITNITEIPFSKYAAGTYIIKVFCNELNSTVIKVVKE